MVGPDDIVVMTGGESRIGTAFRDEYLLSYSDAYRLRLAVRQRGFADARFPDTAFFDLEDRSSVERAIDGARAVLHLAANPRPEAKMESLLGPNVLGAYNLFEAARRSDCERIVFASSVHAVLAMPRGAQAEAEGAPRPDCLYGATKVFGEALCSVFAHEHNLSCIAVRIGAFIPTGESRDWVKTAGDNLAMAVTQRDLCDLLHRCIAAPDNVRYAIVQGVSDNRFKTMDIESARRLVGYDPHDDVFEAAEGSEGP